jgi:Ca2+-binding EF-hand superfamily protein
VLQLLVENETKSESIRQKLLVKQVSVAEAFARYDKDSNGWVSESELVGLLTGLGLDVCEKDLYLILRRFDRDHDGRVSLQEF